MKSFTEFMTEVPRSYVPRIEKLVSDAARVLGDPNSTGEGYEAVAREITAIQQKVGLDSLAALKGEIEERVKARWTKAGRSGLALEQHLTPRLNDLLRRAEASRHILQSRSLFGSLSFKQLAIFGGFALVALAVGGRQGLDALRGIRDVERSAEVAAMIAKIDITNREFDAFLDRVQAAGMVLSPAAQAALPPAIAAAAATPVVATVTTRDGASRTVTAPLGSVYDALPPAGRVEVNSAVSSSSHLRPKVIDVHSPVGTFHGEIR